MTDSHCPYCALQCGMTLTATADGDGVSVGARDFPTNRGRMCGKGWTAAELLTSPERLRTPLMRETSDAPLRPVGWDAALDRVAEGLRAVQARYGSDAAGLLGGGGLTNEKCYLLGKFARVALRSRSIDYNGRFCMSSAAAAGTRALGVDRGLPFPLADLAETDLLLLVGANPAETMPPLMQYVTAMRDRGGRLIAVDPRRTATAEHADLHLQPVPGSDLALACGLLHVLIAEDLVDDAYVAARTTGFDDARATAAGWWPERVERVTGVPAPQLRETARLLAAAPRAMVLTARGTEQHSTGTQTVLAWINLALAAGLPGRPFSGWGCLTGQGNGQGGREHGQKADQLPGYRRLDDPAAREHVAGVWGVDPASLPGAGPSAYELLDALGRDDGVRGLLVAGTNPVVSAPRAAHVESRLRALDLLAVCDVVLSETAALADVVLPVTQWAEETGTMTNLEGRVLLRERAVAPPAGVRTDLDVLAALASRLGCPAAFPTEAEEAFDELARASAGGAADYSGITYSRIRECDGVFWPCPAATDADAAHPGTPRLFTESFPTPDGRARFCAVTWTGSAEEPDADFPLHLTTGRVLAQYQSGAQTRRVPSLAAASPSAFAEISPHLAERHDVVDGEAVRITSRRGEVVVPARVVSTIRDDTVFVPFHWGGAERANSLTNPALDPTSRMPEFKTCAVRLARVEAER
jgi:assimilatory nitrate reductase catalytic subunit